MPPPAGQLPLNSRRICCCPGGSGGLQLAGGCKRGAWPGPTRRFWFKIAGSVKNRIIRALRKANDGGIDGRSLLSTCSCRHMSNSSTFPTIEQRFLLLLFHIFKLRSRSTKSNRISRRACLSSAAVDEHLILHLATAVGSSTFTSLLPKINKFQFSSFISRT